MVVLFGPSSRFALRRDPFNVERSQDRSPRKTLPQNRLRQKSCMTHWSASSKTRQEKVHARQDNPRSIRSSRQRAAPWADWSSSDRERRKARSRVAAHCCHTLQGFARLMLGARDIGRTPKNYTPLLALKFRCVSCRPILTISLRHSRPLCSALASSRARNSRCCGISIGLCPLWVISDRGVRKRPLVHVRFTPESGQRGRRLTMSA